MYEGHFEKYPPVGDIMTHYLLAQMLELLGQYLEVKKSVPGAPKVKPDERVLKYIDWAPWLKGSALDHSPVWSEDDEIEWHAQRLGGLFDEAAKAKTENLQVGN